MNRDFSTCLRDAERFFQEGNRAQARKRIEEALRELRRPMQRLPAWVVPGTLVRWMGDPPHHILKVVEVHRDKPNWWFKGEVVRNDDTKDMIFVNREVGKFYWRRHG